ncbi:hypothetical protein N2152v2_007079 [Parachlorella kessleri]
MAGALAQAEKDEALREKDRLLAEKEMLVLKCTAQAEVPEEKALQGDLEKRLEEKERELNEARQGRGHYEFIYNELFSEARAGLRNDAVAMRHYLRDHNSTLRAAWEAATSAQRQRGIVISAGGTYSTAMVNAFVTVYVLRHHLGCHLPVAIMYWGEYEQDRPSDELQAFFKDKVPGVEFIDASKLPYPPYQRPLAPVKPDGTFVGQVLFLDSDAHPVLDPTSLFDEASYKQHGNLFWRDFYVGDVGMFSVTPMFAVFGLEHPWTNPDSQAAQTESGIILMDRLQNWDVLEWVLFANAHAEVIYRTTYGDKETFRLGYHLAGKAASFQQSIVQFHPNGSVFFHHRTPTKYERGRRPEHPSTHITARASPAFGSHIVHHYLLEKALDDVDAQAVVVHHMDCPYSLYDWPAAQLECAPKYNETQPGLDQQIPVFELPQGSYFQTAEAVGDKGFDLLEREGPRR